MKIFLVVLVPCALLVALSFCCAGPRSNGSADADPKSSAGLARERADLASEPASRRALGADAPRATSAPESLPALEDDELLRHLRAVARGFVENDAHKIELHVEALLAHCGSAREVLSRLTLGAFPSESETETGALLFTGLALARSEPKATPCELGTDLFTRSVLDALLVLSDPVNQRLADFLASLEVGERPVIGAHYLMTMFNLRALQPDRAYLFDSIVEALIRNPSELALLEGDVPELSLVFSQSRDPLVVRAALCALLSADPANFLPIAEDAWRQARNDPALAEAIARAIASHAPLDQAARSLARIADTTQYAQFERLGAREGGLGTVQSEYNKLVASNTDTRARKMLVSAMGTEKDAVLLGIAETDPSADVRHQALLTLTLRPIADEAVVRTLRGARSTAKDPRSGLTTAQQISVASNLALNSNGAVKQGALDVLREITGDARETLALRTTAYDELAQWLSPQELAAVPHPR